MRTSTTSSIPARSPVNVSRLLAFFCSVRTLIGVWAWRVPSACFANARLPPHPHSSDERRNLYLCWYQRTEKPLTSNICLVRNNYENCGHADFCSSAALAVPTHANKHAEHSQKESGQCFKIPISMLNTVSSSNLD